MGFKEHFLRTSILPVLYNITCMTLSRPGLVRGLPYQSPCQLHPLLSQSLGIPSKLRADDPLDVKENELTNEWHFKIVFVQWTH